MKNKKKKTEDLWLLTLVLKSGMSWKEFSGKK